MSERSRKRLCAIAAFYVALCSSSARADALNPSYFVRFDSLDHSLAYIWTVLTLTMIANYLLNFAVIGFPAIVCASVHAKTVAIGLVVLPILGQAADRIGSIVALFVAVPLAA